MPTRPATPLSVPGPIAGAYPLWTPPRGYEAAAAWLPIELYEALLSVRARIWSSGGALSDQHALYWISRQLLDKLGAQQRWSVARALIEEVALSCGDPGWRYAAYCSLAWMSQSAGELDAAERWLGYCDPAVGSLELASLHRACRIAIAAYRGDWLKTLSLTGASHQHVSIDPQLQTWVDFARLAAFDALGRNGEARRELSFLLEVHGEAGARRAAGASLASARYDAILARFAPSEPPRRQVLRPVLTACLLAAMGLGLAAWGTLRAHQLPDTRTWPTTNGVVVESTVEPRSDPGWTGYDRELRVRYRYSVAGREYVSSRFGKDVRYTRKNQSKIAHDLRRYAPGTSIQVHYDPTNPSNSVLNHGERDDTVVVRAAGVLLAAGGSGAACAALLGRAPALRWRVAIACAVIVAAALTALLVLAAM